MCAPTTTVSRWSLATMRTQLSRSRMPSMMRARYRRPCRIWASRWCTGRMPISRRCVARPSISRACSMARLQLFSITPATASSIATRIFWCRSMPSSPRKRRSCLMPWRSGRFWNVWKTPRSSTNSSFSTPAATIPSAMCSRHRAWPRFHGCRRAPSFPTRQRRVRWHRMATATTVCTQNTCSTKSGILRIRQHWCFKTSVHWWDRKAVENSFRNFSPSRNPVPDRFSLRKAVHVQLSPQGPRFLPRPIP